MTSQQLALLRRFASAGMKPSLIAAALGVDYNVVYRAAHRENIKLPRARSSLSVVFAGRHKKEVAQ